MNISLRTRVPCIFYAVPARNASRRLFTVSAFLVSGVSAITSGARADWVQNGTQISPADGHRSLEGLIPDGNGGAIVSWGFLPAGAVYERRHFVQRVDPDGDLLWGANGTPVWGDGWFSHHALTPAGAGGAQMTFELNSVFRIQRITPDGTVVFPSGSTVATSPVQVFFMGARYSDTGETVITWVNVDGSEKLYGQLLNAEGVPMWGPTGKVIVVAYQPDLGGTLIPSLNGEFLAVWTESDERNSSYPQTLARKVTSSGDAVGPLTGLGGHFWGVWTIPDGAGGAYVVSNDNGPSTLADIELQRIGPAANLLWPSQPICTANGNQYVSGVVDDGDNGVIISWDDVRSGEYDEYAQHVGAGGTPLWPTNGLAIAAGDGRQYGGVMTGDGSGGAVFFLQVGDNHWDLLAERVGPDGSPLWNPPAQPVSLYVTSDSYGSGRPRGVLDGAGGILMAWTDVRDGTNSAVYAQRLSLATGESGPSLAVAIEAFSATAHNGVVNLSATFRSDMKVESVNVYRRLPSATMTIIASTEAQDGRHFQFMDRHVEAGTAYAYQIGVVDADGEFFSPIVNTTTPALTTSLEQNQPNPFNPATMFRFTLEEATPAALVVYTTRGERVRTLVHGLTQAGTHSVSWDGTNDAGVHVASGIYLYRLTAGKFSATRKMLLLK